MQGVPGGTISSHWIVDSGASRHMTGDMKLSTTSNLLEEVMLLLLEIRVDILRVKE